MNFVIESTGNLEHTYIGGEHIVLGLLKENTSMAATALNKLQVTVTQLEQSMSEKIGIGIRTSLSADDFVSYGKRILQIVVMETVRPSHNCVGAERLLIAILSEGDSYSVRFLQSLGMRSGDILNGISSALSSGEDSVPAPGMSLTSSDKGGESVTKTPGQFGCDFTVLIAKDGIDPVAGRQTEIKRVI